MSQTKHETVTQQLYDVVAIRLDKGGWRTLAKGKTLENADAIIEMAIARRGVKVEFYKAVPVRGTI